MTLRNYSTGITCSRCMSECFKVSENDCGYARLENNHKLCYDCADQSQLKHMLKTGKAVLYLTQRRDDESVWHETSEINTVGTWSGTMKFRCLVRKGRHNIARKRYDLWFWLGDSIWHGVQYGEWTQIARCKRTKQKDGLPRKYQQIST